jgi:hypothetical protein
MSKVKKSVVSLTAIALAAGGVGLSIAAPWEAEGAANWQCERLAQAAVGLRAQAAAEPIPADVPAETARAQRDAVLSDIDKGLNWAKAGCVGEGGGEMVPGLYRSITSGSENGSTVTYTPKR